MKKLIKWFTLVVVIAVAAFVPAACSFNETGDIDFDANNRKFTVYFDGYYEYNCTVLEGAKVPEPLRPQRDDYNFVGWYTDRDFNIDALFDFDTPITDNIWLYAKWTPKEYEVVYDCNGGTYDGKDFSRLIIPYGEQFELPNPSREGYVFLGWQDIWQERSGICECNRVVDPVTNLVAQWAANYLWELEEDDNGYVVKRLLSSAPEIRIPRAYNGKPVYKIAATCRGYDTVESIYIPDSITEIEDGALTYCSRLKQIQVNDLNNVYTDYYDSNIIFEKNSRTLVLGCKESQIDFGDFICKIGKQAFAGCTGLTQINIPSSVTEIGVSAFEDCSNLWHVLFREGGSKLKIIGDYAFNNCKAYNGVGVGGIPWLPDSVVTIGRNAFANTHVDDLGTFYMPKSVMFVGTDIFAGVKGEPIKGKFIIYCYPNEKPTGWSDDWLYGLENVETVQWGQDWRSLF